MRVNDSGSERVFWGTDSDMEKYSTIYYSESVTYVLADSTSYYSIYFYKKTDASGDYIEYKIPEGNFYGTYRKK